jgi:hypothetical protein
MVGNLTFDIAKDFEVNQVLLVGKHLSVLKSSKINGKNVNLEDQSCFS